MMSSVISNIVPRKFAEATATTQFTATIGTTIIDKFTATNVSGSSVTFTCYLTASSESASSSNKVLDQVSISPNETYLCPELVGQVLRVNGKIVTAAGASSAIVISVSGREIK